MMSDLTQRRNIRALTDGLKPNEWAGFGVLYARLPIPRLQRAAAYGLFRDMLDAGQLERRGKQKSFEYRSGSRPVVDGRINNGTRRRVRLGFMQLARLRESDPEAYAKAIAVEAPVDFGMDEAA